MNATQLHLQSDYNFSTHGRKHGLSCFAPQTHTTFKLSMLPFIFLFSYCNQDLGFSYAGSMNT